MQFSAFHKHVQFLSFLCVVCWYSFFSHFNFSLCKCLCHFCLTAYTIYDKFYIDCHKTVIDCSAIVDINTFSIVIFIFVKYACKIFLCNEMQTKATHFLHELLHFLQCIDNTHIWICIKTLHYILTS